MPSESKRVKIGRKLRIVAKKLEKLNDAAEKGINNSVEANQLCTEITNLLKAYQKTEEK